MQHEYNTSTIRHNTSTTRPNRSSKEALAGKIGLYLALFVTELYIFLISFRSSSYSPTCNIFSTLWIPRAYKTSFQNTKQPRTYDVLLLYVKRKIAIQLPKTCYSLFSVLSATAVASKSLPLATKRKSRIKLDKLFITLKCISSSFLPA